VSIIRRATVTGLRMRIKEKLLLRAVMSLMIVIIISTALLTVISVKAWQSSSSVAYAAGATFLLFASFAVSLFFFRICTKPLLKLMYRDEQEVLLKTREQFTGFMDELPIGVFIKDDQSRAVYLNKYMDKVFCKPNCIGKTPYNIFDREIANRVILEDKRALSGESFMVEEVLTDKHGKERIYMTHKFCMWDGQGNKRMIGGISIEITLRREAEYKLRILSQAIKNSPVCVLITDPHGHIEYVNPAFVNSTGYSFAEVMGENMSIINSGNHEKAFFSEMWKKIKSGGDWQGEILNRRKDGTSFWEFVSISSVTNRHGEITHYVAIKDDISKRKLVEEAHKQAKEKAEENDRLKSAFLANMSHEIRTPMNAIVGLSGLMADPELSFEEKENFSAIIKENSDVLLQLIDDIVDISKIEAGQIIMRPAGCNVNALMRDIYDTFKIQIKERENKLKLILNLEELKGEIRTFTDAQRLRQVITNLVSNALKFTDRGSVELGCRMDNETRLLFFVKDTGIGIPKNKHEMIFDRFGQVDDSRTKIHRGAGLGLSISRSLVQLMGGSIWVKSEKGKGAAFFFTVPYRQALPLQEKPEQEVLTWPVLNDRNILLIENRKASYGLTGKMLRKTGAGILRAGTGAQALEIINTVTDLALVLLDLNLPDKDGYDILQEIRKISPDVPVIIQTAYAMNGERERCLKAGCNGYITKPVSIERLIAVIRQCVVENHKPG
jgi:PAS domain S-box-containing protein